MTKPEETSNPVDLLRRRRSDLTTSAGANAHLTVATLLCGFAFAGLILYLGTDHPRAAHVVAASLLAAAFIMLLYAGLSTAYLVQVSDRKQQLMQLLYERSAAVPGTDSSPGVSVCDELRLV